MSKNLHLIAEISKKVNATCLCISMLTVYLGQNGTIQIRILNLIPVMTLKGLKHKHNSYPIGQHLSESTNLKQP